MIGPDFSAVKNKDGDMIIRIHTENGRRKIISLIRKEIKERGKHMDEEYFNNVALTKWDGKL